MSVVSAEGEKIAFSLNEFDTGSLEIIYTPEHIAAMDVEYFSDAFEGMTFCGKGNCSNRAVCEEK
jgi:hypothetical protein